MRIFITGGSGFIGRHLVSKLVSGKHNLLLLSNNPDSYKTKHSKKITYLKGNLKEISSWGNELSEFKPEAVIHLAWEGIPDYGISMSKRNFTYSKKLFELSAKVGCKKIISVGSAWEYGDASGAVKESDSRKPPHQPVVSFVEAKNQIKLTGERISDEFGIQFIWAILFFVYGPRQKSASLIPFLISQYNKKSLPIIKNKKGGNDFIYVDDVVSAINALLLRCKKQKEVYNIGAGYLTSVAKINNIVAKEFGMSKRMKEPPKITGFYANILKIKKDVGWKPKFSIEQGVDRTIKNFKNENKK